MNMISVAVFENVILSLKLETVFFRYCRRRQPHLWKYTVYFWLVSLLRFFGFIGRDVYLEKRWSFLGDVKEADKMLERFFAPRRRHMFFPDSHLHIISEHPYQVVKAAMDGIDNVVVHANSYSLTEDRYTEKLTLRQIIGDFAEGDPVMIYDRANSELRENADGYSPVAGKRMFRTNAGCIAFLTAKLLGTLLFLLAASVLFGIVGMYFSSLASAQPESQFLSYIGSFGCIALNTAPVIAAVFLIYTLTGSPAIAVTLPALITTTAAVINYYTLLLYNTPLSVYTITHASDYVIPLSSFGLRAVVALTLVVITAVFTAFHFKSSFGFARIRAAIFVLLLVVAAVVGARYYSSADIYKNTDCSVMADDETSEAQQFISHGFLYPAIYNTMTDKTNAD